MRSAWFLFINVGYLVLILLVSYILFTVPAQTEDFIYVFLQDFDIVYISAVYSALFVWCAITWYSACINLQIDPVKGSLDRSDSKLHIRLSLWFPRILGVVPCIIFAKAVWSVDHLTEHNYQMFHVLCCTAFVIAMMMVFLFIDRYADRSSSRQDKKVNKDFDYNQDFGGFWNFMRTLCTSKKLSNWPTWEEVRIFKTKTGNKPTFAQELIFISQFSGVRFYYLYMGAFCLLVTVAMSIPQSIFILSHALRPGAVLIISIACFTLLFTIIAYFHDYSTRPFGIIVLVAVIVFSFFNDNTAIPFVNNSNVSKRKEIKPVFDAWLQKRRNTWRADTVRPKEMPVVFIATQGGGIRGLTWTTRVLHYLDTTYKGFINQTFLISGVSGGGVGATAYLSWLHDRQNGRNTSYEAFNEFTKKDFLSPVTASFAFGDNLQRFIPYPIPALDRSKVLGKAWEQSYTECTNVSSFASPFLDMWYTNNTFNYNIPSLMLNGTLAENGQRVVTSNLDLKTQCSDWFKDDVDFFAFTRRDISRSFAALNCSRFPFITSGGLMQHGDYKMGHVVDGGYRENTGLQTLLNVFCTIRPTIRPLIQQQDIRIIIIYLQNGIDELNTEVSASKWFQDVLTPLKGIYQVNGTGLPAKSIVQFVQQTFDSTIYPNVEFHVLSLEKRDNHAIKLPLGWYMSEVISNEIDKRVQDIPKIDTTMTKSLKNTFRRH